MLECAICIHLLRRQFSKLVIKFVIWNLVKTFNMNFMLFDRVFYVIVLAHIKIIVTHFIFYCLSTNTLLTHVILELFINKYFFLLLIYILNSLVWLLIHLISLKFYWSPLSSYSYYLLLFLFYFIFNFILFFHFVVFKRLHILFFRVFLCNV